MCNMFFPMLVGCGVVFQAYPLELAKNEHSAAHEIE
jgi:hypothetical protein